MSTVLAGTGMRRGEIVGLAVDRVSKDFNTIRVDRQLHTTEPTWKPPKTPSSVRTMAVPDIVLEAIEDQKKTCGIHESGLIFTNKPCLTSRPDSRTPRKVKYQVKPVKADGLACKPGERSRGTGW